MIEDFELRTPSEVLKDYHYKLLNKAKSINDIEFFYDELVQNVENSKNTAVAIYFVDTFLKYLDPFQMLNIMEDQMQFHTKTSKREGEANLDMIRIEQDYASVFRAIAPFLCVDYYVPMSLYLQSIIERGILDD